MNNVLVDLLKVKKKEFIFTGILSSLVALLTIVPYLLIYYVIKEFLEHGENVDLGHITTIFLFATFAVIARYTALIAAFTFSHIAAFDLLYLIRTKLTKHLGKLPLGFWSKNSSGKVRKIIQEDVERIEMFTAHHVPDMIIGFVLPIVTITALFFINWKMALATLIPLPICLLMIKWMFQGVGKDYNRKEMFEKYHKAIEGMHSTIVEYVQGMPVVKAFNVTINSFNRLKDSVLGYKKLTVGISKSQTPFYAVFTAFTLAGGLFIIPTGIYLLKNGQLDGSTFILFLILGTGCFSQLVPVLGIVGHCEIIFSAGDRIGEILNTEALYEPKNPVVPENHDLSIQNLSFKYEKDSDYALKNINLDIKANSFIAVVGESGAGKSTLVHLISRMWDVEEGSINIGGHNIKEIGTSGLNKLVGMVFQDVQMLTDTVKENIAMGKDMPMEKIIEAAKTAQCHEFIKALPKGYDTVIGDGGDVHLSGGEKQRISLARVILKDAPIILLDEASCYSDADNELKIQKAFSSVMKNKTVIVIAHRLSTIVHADKIVVVNNGEIVEYGSHKELLDQSGVYSKMWNAHTMAKNWKLDDDLEVN